jgi:hypothetical protein
MHTRARARARTRTHTHARAFAHTHTHKYIWACVQYFWSHWISQTKHLEHSPLEWMCRIQFILLGKFPRPVLSDCKVMAAGSRYQILAWMSWLRYSLGLVVSISICSELWAFFMEHAHYKSPSSSASVGFGRYIIGQYLIQRQKRSIHQQNSKV